MTSKATCNVDENQTFVAKRSFVTSIAPSGTVETAVRIRRGIVADYEIIYCEYQHKHDSAEETKLNKNITIRP